MFPMSGGKKITAFFLIGWDGHTNTVRSSWIQGKKIDFSTKTELIQFVQFKWVGDVKRYSVPLHKVYIRWNIAILTLNKMVIFI